MLAFCCMLEMIRVSYNTVIPVCKRINVPKATIVINSKLKKMKAKTKKNKKRK